MGASCCSIALVKPPHHNNKCTTAESTASPVKIHNLPQNKNKKKARAKRRVIPCWPGEDPLRDAFLSILQKRRIRSPRSSSRPPARRNDDDSSNNNCNRNGNKCNSNSNGNNCNSNGNNGNRNSNNCNCNSNNGNCNSNGNNCNCNSNNCNSFVKDDSLSAAAASRDFDVSLRHAAAAAPPLLFLFSHPLVAPPRCLRCPHCKGCQTHMRHCSGAYGLRHRLHWIRSRAPPHSHSHLNSHSHSHLHSISICRFEVGPLAITRHVTYTSREQVVETMRRGGRDGPFAGVICPRPLNCIDVFAGLFFGTTRRTGDKTFYHRLQCTAMRAVAAQAKALWELLTFSPERGGHPAHDWVFGEDENFPLTPQRVPMDWRYPPWFFSITPSAAVGPTSEVGGKSIDGMAFRLWLSQRSQDMLTAHVMNERQFWKFPHTCALKVYEWKKKKSDNLSDSSSETDEAEDESSDMNKWGGEVKCSRCYIPPAFWGLIIRRHCKEKDVPTATLRARRECNRRRKERMGNSVSSVNLRKTRAQFMALIVAYMMRTTVCGPYKQYLLCDKQHK